eukprot:TRINITY_DN1061_c7_g1_i1.p1 TRINITY_DN1061_c7_g1~~TRINITY_DN1061_c7_g1_i1.p1  ORF type:complete len:2466 (-),score=573.86 TRINITY_DN1061_c7_g1_i1:99-7496(-)
MSQRFEGLRHSLAAGRNKADRSNTTHHAHGNNTGVRPLATKAVSEWEETFTKLYNELKTRNDETRSQGAKNLTTTVKAQKRELPREKFAKFMRELINMVAKLVNGNTMLEKLGGVYAVRELIHVDYDENVLKINRLANFLHVLLNGPDLQVTEASALALGELVSSGEGTLTAECAEREILRAFEMLNTSPGTEVRKHTAMLVLREVATNAPTLFYVHVEPLFNDIWVGLHDAKLAVRECSREALAATLEITKRRDTSLRSMWYTKFYERCTLGFNSTKEESIHGSLLGLGELLKLGSEVIADRIEPICNKITKFRDHKSSLVKKTVIVLMPYLAEHHPEDFVRLGHLQSCMSYCLDYQKKDTDCRLASYVAVGRMCKALAVHRTKLHPYVREIIPMIKAGLVVKKGHPVAPEVLMCISYIADAFGMGVEKQLGEVLPHMFSGGLTESLTTSLTSVATVPTLLPLVQDKILDLMSFVLAKKPFFKPEPTRADKNLTVRIGDRKLRERRAGSIVANFNIPMIMAVSTGGFTSEAPSEEVIVLALRTLATFDLSRRDLCEFVRDTVINYLDDSRTQVRCRAAATSAMLLVKTDEQCPTRGKNALIIAEVIEKMLIVGITDPETEIRATVLASLDTRYDYFLAQSENLRSLFMALNDETFRVRELAISIIGRLAVRNPADVMPSLRKTLVQLLTELEFSGDVKNKDESTRLLGHLINSSGRLVAPYVQPALDALLPKLASASETRVSIAVLGALGELSRVAEEEMRPHLPTIMPVILEYLQDQGSTQKREVAIRCLGQICAATGYVIQPLIDYPDLLDILLTAIQTEQAPTIRRELIKVLGTLGALDPHRYKNLRQMGEQSSQWTNIEIGGMDSLIRQGGDKEEMYYLGVAIDALRRILGDVSLRSHHTRVMDGLMYIFKKFGNKCQPYLPIVIPPLVAVMHECESNFRKLMFQHMKLMVSIVKASIADFLDSIFVLVQKFWGMHLLEIIALVSEVASVLNEQVKAYLPQLIPKMLLILHTDRAADRSATLEIMKTLEIFGHNLEDYLHLVVPTLGDLVDDASNSVRVRMAGMQTIARLCHVLDMSEYASRICHPLARVLTHSATSPELTTVALETLCALAYQLGSDFAIFIPMINKILSRNNIQHQTYDAVVTMILKNQSLEGEDLPKLHQFQRQRTNVHSQIGTMLSNMQIKQFTANEQNLQKAWVTSKGATKDDWFEWMRRFSVELLRETPSPALRSCLALAQVYHPLARELFNAGFISCWTAIRDKSDVVKSLNTALDSPNIPPEVLQTLLNLAEFMEHEDLPLPIDMRKLDSLAVKCHAYAKALHYKEVEFRKVSSPDPSIVEGLISINNHLQQPEAAIGILLYAQDRHAIDLRESWYEKLERWDDALFAYRQKARKNPKSVDLTFGQMRCLHALCEWDELSRLARTTWEATMVENPLRANIAPLGAIASWNLGNWSDMREYVNAIDKDKSAGQFFKAVLAVHEGNFGVAQRLIDRARELTDTELTALVGESYNRAYDMIVRVQMLRELEEVIEYKQDPARAPAIRRIWADRMKGCQQSVDVWQRVLSVRSLVLPPEEDVDLWLKYSAVCRKAGRLRLSHRLISDLLRVDPDQLAKAGLKPDIDPRIALTFVKLIWADESRRHEAFQMLNNYTMKRPTDDPYLAKCYLTLGDFQSLLCQLDGTLDQQSITQILRCYRRASELEPSEYKAWHKWALMNFEAATHYEKQIKALREQQRTGSIAGGTSVKHVAASAAATAATRKKLIKQRQAHLVPAVRGFFRSIALGPGRGSGQSLQDTLRLVTLWFTYGNHESVTDAMSDGFSTIDIDTWLEVIPQIIARVDSNIPAVRRMVLELLSQIGNEHPQALVYPLTVASTSETAPRREAAQVVLEKMCKRTPSLVEDALLVSEELVRVSIIWHEMWHEALEEASRCYFTDNNAEGMVERLRPMHKNIDQGPVTMKEQAFEHTFGRDLREAEEWSKRWEKTKAKNDLNQAWDLYYVAFKKINTLLPQMKILRMRYVSPKLEQASNLSLAVPGTYDVGCEMVTIRSFGSMLQVITSKQRPRKCSIFGSDGKEYTFLLKGHEDLRQDERVMQLFGLVNTLLKNDPETSKGHLRIVRYPAVPLSQNSGLIGWVPNTDTMHALIQEYRTLKGIDLKLEHRRMHQMCGTGYERLPLSHKVEVFRFALDGSQGEDLHKVLWLKARNSEVWLDRRTNYSRSLAVTSMVGYLLGLGDRHPSNIMVERETGRVLHIDFGDCFEVAMHRDKFPEKVPFRLTRMMVNAMEVSGVEGNYRVTCENVMRVMREHKESLMAVLEAFVYDPLLGWKLLAERTNKYSGPEFAANIDVSADDGGNAVPDSPVGSMRNSDVNAAKRARAQVKSASGSTKDNSSVPDAESTSLLGGPDADDGLNEKAVAVINRVQAKLTGRDFSGQHHLDVPSQVGKLIDQAQSHENLSQAYVGWCPFW